MNMYQITIVLNVQADTKDTAIKSLTPILSNQPDNVSIETISIPDIMVPTGPKSEYWS